MHAEYTEFDYSFGITCASHHHSTDAATAQKDKWKESRVPARVCRTERWVLCLPGFHTQVTTRVKTRPLSLP